MRDLCPACEEEEADEPMEFDEFFHEYILNAVMWMVMACIAFAAAGSLFLFGAFCFWLGLALLR